MSSPIDQEAPPGDTDDDLAFVEETIRTLGTDQDDPLHESEPRRVYLVGMSHGGLFVRRERATEVA